MLQSLRLLLPALIPSWRFFEQIEPSPRIEFRLLKSPGDTAETWQEFRPRPECLSIGSMLKRLLWNPRWNESLFLVSCSERLMLNPTEHSRDEIFARIAAELRRDFAEGAQTPYLQFRLVFVSRNGEDLEKQVTFLSPVECFFEGGEA